MDKRNAFKDRFQDMYDLLTYGVTNLKSAEVGQLLNKTIYWHVTRDDLLELWESVLWMSLIMDVKNRLKNAKKWQIIDRQSLLQYWTTAFKAEFWETMIGAILWDTWRKDFRTKIVSDTILNAFADKLWGKFWSYTCNESEKKSLTRLHPLSKSAEYAITKIDITISLLENLHNELKHKTFELADCLYVGRLLEFNKINFECRSEILWLPQLLKESLTAAWFFDIKLCDNVSDVMNNYMLLDWFKEIENQVGRLDNHVLGLFKLFRSQDIDKKLEDMICRLNGVKVAISR